MSAGVPIEPGACDLALLVARFDAPLRRFARARLRDDAAADDAVQETWLRVHGRLDTVRDCARLPGWIFRVARNAVVDEVRRRRPVEALDETLPAPADPCEGDVVCELAAGLEETIGTLPAADREALLPLVREGLTQEQVAGRLGISLSGAKSRVQRARERLRQRLLECCHFTLDRFGRPVDYEERCGCCCGRRPEAPSGGG